MATPNQTKEIRSIETSKDVFTKLFNKEVRAFFRDIKTSNLNLNISRQAVMKAVLIEDEDPIMIRIEKFNTFYYLIKRGEAFNPTVYGLLANESESFIGHPQVTLYFRQDPQDTDEDYPNPVKGRISFRLMNESVETITENQLKGLAKKISNKFLKPKPYKWRKGKESYSYRDKSKGYEFKVYSRSENDAKALIQEVMNLQNHQPNFDELLRKNEATKPSQAFPNLPKPRKVIGKKRKGILKRPIADVFFIYAICSLGGGVEVPLVDSTFKYPDAFEFD